ncbi:MAG: NADH-quinone oxidoreductase subunit L [Acidobacteriota bacterium]
MVNLVSNFWWIPLYPLIGAALIAFFRRGVSFLAPAAVSLSFLHGLAVWLSPRSGPLDHTLSQWMPGLPMAFHADALSLLMVLIISGIGLLIHLYSLSYMAGEDGFWRYFACLNLFVFFMLLLVLANNLIFLFAGWEGVGLASYLLIGFHHDRPTVNRNANKAFLYNRAGDAGFLLGALILLDSLGSVDFSVINAAPATSATLAAALLLAFGATGKSAQLPLFVWLPDAMVGPTPVSALIHAATMVTAGIYLFARLQPFLLAHPEAGLLIASLGAITSLLAATIALVENDIKRILAYSTVSQLGLMFLAAGLGATSAAMFHVATHAFFKALLFLTAGNVIHGLRGEQDIRFMGGLHDKMPWTFRLMTLAGLSLAGLPGLAGFFSKEAILHAAAAHPLLLAMALLSAFLTALYTSRMLWAVFYGSYRREAHEAHGFMLHSLWPLGLGSALAGFFGPHPPLSWPLLLASATASLGGLYFGRNIRIPGLIEAFLKRRWFVSEAYELVLVTGLTHHGSRLLLWFDLHIIDSFNRFLTTLASLLSSLASLFDRLVVDGLVHLIAFTTELLSYPLRLLQSGRIHHYALVLLLTLALTLGWYRLA